MPIYCNQCGNALATDVTFCPVCGALAHELTSTFPANIQDARKVEIRSYRPVDALENHPPAPPRQRVKPGLLIGILSGIIVILIVLGTIGVFAFLQVKGNPITPQTNFPALSAPTAHPTQALPTAVPTQPTPACGGAFSDTFSTGRLQNGWTWVNPTGLGRYSVNTPPSLTINSPSGSDMNPTTNTNAPRILQPISGNFTISTLVKFPQIQADGFQAAGLLLWQDQNNFLRVDRYISSIDFEQVANGVFTHEAPNSLASAIITSNQMELQIQRKNGFFTASWRIPGQSWNTINTIGLPLQNMMVGFDMINDASSDMSATFAYFQASCA